MNKKILVIDNYDSFTYNLVHAIEKIQKHEVDVYRNDEIDIASVEKYDYIFISPGPGIPEEAGITLQLIGKYYKSKKIFGVCLGLQSIIVALGGSIVNLPKVFHGIETEMKRTESDSLIFKNIGEVFTAGRYHSWVTNKADIPESLKVTSVDDTEEVMSIEHKNYPVFAVQFHPESIMTPDGELMIKNFLEI